MPSIAVTTNDTTTLTLSGDDFIVTVLSTGSIMVPAGNAIHGQSGPFSYNLLNFGDLSSDAGVGVLLQGNVNDVENQFGASIIGSTIGLHFDTTGTARSELFNQGSILGGDAGVALSGSADARRSNVTNLGFISSDDVGIDAETRLTLVNNVGATISADGAAIALGGAAATSRIFNIGTISGDMIGIQTDVAQTLIDNRAILTGAIGVRATDSVTVKNTGTITGSDGTAIWQTGEFAGSVRNFGTVDGGIIMGDGTSKVINGGTITGSVQLGDGDDMYNGKAGSVSGPVSGGAGNDTLLAGAAGNHLIGGTGEDSLIGNGGIDTLDGGADNDRIVGGGGNDRILGRDGDDLLHGDLGDDFLRGGRGDDLVFGGSGADTLNGGGGADTLTGGADEDVFVFTKIADSTLTAFDKITDYNTADDAIDLSGLVPGSLTLNILGSFSGTGPSAITVETPAGHTRVMIDVDGDGAADMRIDLRNVTGLDAFDFIL